MTFEEEVVSRVVRREGELGYDENGNEIYYKNTTGYECWSEFDENNNAIHYKGSSGYEWWKEFDEDNNEIYYKDSHGEVWREYDENSKLILKKELKRGEFGVFDDIMEFDWQPVITLDERN